MEPDTLSQLVTNLGIGVVGNEIIVKSEEPTPNTSGESSAEVNAPLNTEECKLSVILCFYCYNKRKRNYTCSCKITG